MINQLFIGACLIFLTIFIQAIFTHIAANRLEHHGVWLSSQTTWLKSTFAISLVVFWLIIGISLSAWGWAVLFYCLGAFDTIEPALYFSIVTFTTLGYGDITLGADWRILAGLSATNGLIIFGLNTAFLIELSSRLRIIQERSHLNNKSPPDKNSDSNR